MRKPWKRLAVMAGLGMCLAFPMTAYAEPAEAISEREVTYHFFDEETTGTMALYFKDDMPSVPYISVSDYLGKITVKTFTEQEENGKIVVSGEAGKITVDTENDIVTFDSYGKLLKEDNYYVKPGSAMDNNYTQLTSQEYVKTAGETTMDFSKYDIDILAIDGKAYFPLTTITDLFAASYNSAEYYDGELYFLNTMETFVLGDRHEGYMDKTSLFNAETRDASLVDYSYNEMCFFFDSIYGKPAQCKLAESIKNIGFDQTLETYNEDTKKAKELLHSTDIMEFTEGLLILQTYMYDGGHTLLPIEALSESRAYPDSYIGKAYEGGDIASLMQTNPLVAQAMQTQMGKEMAGRQFIETRGITFQAAGYEMVMGGAAEWDDETALFRSGDTVVFVFNNFMKNVVPWFKRALDYAEKNGVKNFIVDLTTNGGGDASVMGYMIAIMKNKNRDSNEAAYSIRNEVTGDEIRTTFAYDLNLDGAFDEKDKKVAYDLNYAFITSAYSFSCANLTPFMAKEQGIMVMGMTSGGGACSIMKSYTPDAHSYMVSSNKYFTTTTGEDVDLGIKVDAELVRITGEGEIDLTGFYNIPALGVLMNEFYGVYTSEWVDGVWYDKNHQMTYAGIGQWVKSKEGKWTYVDTLGWSPKNQWQKIDGKWYFFDKEGVMETKAYRQGYYLMANGAWDGKTKAAGWKQDSKGWWYSLGGSDFLKNGWKKIDGNWYYFKANGYIAVNEFVQGWWVGRNGVQSDPVKYGWHKSGSKWWYGVKDGWYAKSKSYIIDGKTYAFDKDGYTK